MYDFLIALIALCGAMLICLAICALAERKVSKKGWRRLMKPLEGTNERVCVDRRGRSGISAQRKRQALEADGAKVLPGEDGYFRILREREHREESELKYEK